MNRGSKRLGLLLSLFLGFSLYSSPSVYAGGNFQLEPLSVDFFPSGSLATQSFILKSTGDKPVAIQLSMAIREISLDGTETNVDADDQFLIYPPQLVIPPGEQQTVRVTWLGDPIPTKELAFRIIAEQVPVDLTEIKQTEGDRTVTVRVLLRYRGSVYIKPEGVAPKLVLESASSQKDKAGADKLVLNVANQGTAHKLLQNIKVTVKAGSGQSVTLAGKQLEGVLGENILADSKRQFILPWPKEIPVGPVTATFDTNP
jgi:fimbrial chaperone protein